MSNKEFIRFSDGRTVDLRTLTDSVSADLYQSSLHYQVVRQLASCLECQADVRMVLENILALKSYRARVITALVWHVDQGEGVAVQAGNDICDFLEYLRLDAVVIQRIPDADPTLISRKQVIPIIFKAVLHRVYRLLSSRPNSGANLIRGWVEVTAAMYKDLMPVAETRIYPFPFGIIRHVKFIRQCRKHGWRYSLDGLPYSILGAVLAFFLRTSRALRLAQLEHQAFLQYAEQVKTWQPKAIYTSDEYEAGAVILYSYLLKQDIKSVNTAHGVGTYCPNVSYSEFRAFTAEQGNFYRDRCASMVVTIRSKASISSPLHPGPAANLTPAFVLIHQNFNDFHLPAEQTALLKLAACARTAARKTGTKYFIKLHPNTPPGNIHTIAQDLGGQPLLAWDELRSYRPIFLLINSTTYFELYHIAPVLVYAAPSFIPELYFGPIANTVTEDNCLEKLTELLENGAWTNAVERQLALKEVT